MLDVETAVAHAEAALAELKDALGQQQGMDSLIRERAAKTGRRFEIRVPQPGEPGVGGSAGSQSGRED